MRRTFGWKLVGAFGLIIGLTALLSGGFALWATTQRFDVLVTDESRRRAVT